MHIEDAGSQSIVPLLNGYMVELHERKSMQQ